MIRALNSGASGMHAQQFQLDMIANNLANAGTTAFKSSRANFEDVFYEHLRFPGQIDNQGKLTGVGQSVGLGTRIQSTQLDQRNGSLKPTDGELDLAIVGEGFFQVQDGSQFLYTRAGNFTRNAEGEIILTSSDRGRPLEPSITIPQDTISLTVSSDGNISVRQAGQTDMQNLGQLQLVRFINPQGLVQEGENLFSQSAASGPPVEGTPGTDGIGVIRQRFLENSNVEPVRELVGLITTQRNFELSSQVIRVADEEMQLVADLRRL